jgi:hypothetical protein
MILELDLKLQKSSVSALILNQIIIFFTIEQ